MATQAQAVTIARYVAEGAKKIGGEKDPLKARSIVDSYVVENIRKDQPASFMSTLGAMDIQDAMNADPAVPNLPAAPLYGTPGVYQPAPAMTPADVEAMMAANNDKLVTAMGKMIAEQNASK
jgi:hypothetical protein